jgi:hypothetical protein
MVKDFRTFTLSFTILMLNVDFWVLTLGVLDGTAQFSALSKYLVPNGRQVLRKGVKLGGSATDIYTSYNGVVVAYRAVRQNHLSRTRDSYEWRSLVITVTIVHACARSMWSNCSTD